MRSKVLVAFFGVFELGNPLLVGEGVRLPPHSPPLIIVAFLSVVNTPSIALIMFIFPGGFGIVLLAPISEFIAMRSAVGAVVADHFVRPRWYTKSCVNPSFLAACLSWQALIIGCIR